MTDQCRDVVIRAPGGTLPPPVPSAPQPPAGPERPCASARAALWLLLFFFRPKSLCFVREVSIMLPCQGTCPNYQPGCHKCCAEWKLLQDRQRVQRQQKKAYLDYYNDLCLTMTRQFRSLSPSRLTR